MAIFGRLGHKSSCNNKGCISSVSNIRSSTAKSYGSNGKGALSYGEYGFSTGLYHAKNGLASYQMSSVHGKLCKRLYKMGPYKLFYKGSNRGSSRSSSRGSNRGSKGSSRGSSRAVGVPLETRL